MTATVLVVLCVIGTSLVVTQPGCSSSTTATPADGTGTVASAAGVGDPCTAQIESDATFGGFREKEVNLEPMSPSCKTGLCLVNHFRGRASCPYGQAADGTAPSGASACTTPSAHAAVTKAVAPQCADRTAAKSVYCSCRCANVNGQTNDGQAYCGCPDGFQCTPLVTSIGADPDHMAGSYCIKAGTAYDAATACSQGDCTPGTKPCP